MEAMCFIVEELLLETTFLTEDEGNLVETMLTMVEWRFIVEVSSVVWISTISLSPDHNQSSLPLCNRKSSK